MQDSVSFNILPRLQAWAALISSRLIHLASAIPLTVHVQYVHIILNVNLYSVPVWYRYCIIYMHVYRLGTGMVPVLYVYMHIFNPDH
jgi:hypothetical protein